MGSPLSLLGNARAFARDYARDEMPPGYLWDVLDFVPSIIDTTLTGRGAWAYGCAASGVGDIEAGILATFRSSEQLLVQSVGGRVLRVNNDGGVPPGNDPAANSLTNLGAAWRSVQNPVQLGEDVIHFDRDGLHVPQLWREGAIVNAFADMGRPRVGTVWKGSLVSGGGQGPTGNDEGDLLRFSVAGADLATAASYDVNSNIYTSARITGLQAMRSMVLIFHPGSIERLRGGPFPNTAKGEDGLGLVLDTLTDRVGCINPQSIAVWNDQVIFADEHGVHMTDGATVRNLTTQGGISTYWRLLYEGAASIAASCFLDYYVISIRHPPTRPPLPDLELFDVQALDADPLPRPPVPPLPPNLPPIRPPVPDPVPDAYTTTLIVDLNRKGWFRMSNMNALCFIASSGSSGMERLWGGLSGYARLARFGPAFFPPEGVEQIDGNGLAVLPRFETAWYRLGQEGRKRVRFAYLSYDCYGFAPVTAPVRVGYLTSSPTGRDYAQAGTLPLTNGYRRLRLPINKFPYGLAFYVETTQPTGFIRVYDLALEAQAAERSRV